MPKLSVVVPIYNVDKYLKECITSIQTQNFQDIEIICVNDGSKDNSLEILREFESNDPRIIIIDKANTGYGDSMNIGMSASNGKFLAIVEPDDFILPGMFKTLLNAIESHSLDLVKSDFYRFMSSDNAGYKRTYNQLSRFYNLYNRPIFPEKEQKVFLCAMNTWSGIYNIDFLRKNNILHNTTPGASFQDNGFWFNGFACAKRIMFLDRAFYMNRRDNPNSSVKDRKKIFCMNEEYKFIKKFLIDTDKFDTFFDIYLHRKWANYFFTIKRLSPSLRKTYIHEISKELKNDYEAIKSSKSYFDKRDQQKLQLMKTLPSLYTILFNLKHK